jgi:hypothetical protein
MENAKKLREQRINGDGGEIPTFTPQVNSRPAYLMKQDSLDKLTGNIPVDPSDVFEQPLPGSRPKQPVYNEPMAKLPSPGSDALGKEMRRFPGHNDENTQGNAGPAYQSKFLQQYSEANNSMQSPPPNGGSRVMSLQQHQEQKQMQLQQQQYQQQQQQQYAQEDDGFASSLRGGGGPPGGGSGRKAVSKGWNDDVSTEGFGAAKPLPRVRAGAGAGGQQQGSYSARYEEEQQQQYNREAAPRRRPQAQQQRVEKEWNMDTEVNYAAPAPSLPPRISPRGTMGSGPGSGSSSSAAAAAATTVRGAGSSQLSPRAAESAANQARPNLSLLKSRIRRSESGRNVMEKSDSAASYGAAGQEYGGDAPNTAPYGYAPSESAADVRRNGRRSAPNPSAAGGAGGGGGRSNYASTAGAGSDYDQYASQPPPAQQSHNHAPRNSQYRQPPVRNDYEEDDNPYGPDAYPPGMSAPRMQQQQQQQPKSVQAAPRRTAARPTAAAMDDNPYGPDAYPPGHSAPRSSQQAPPQRQQQQQQHRQQAPSMNDNPYGPDAYPPGMSAPDMSEYPDDSAGGPQMQCPDCGRKFNPIPYSKHVIICAKVFQQKRKVFDSSKMRIEAVGDPELLKIAAQKEKEARMQAMRDKKKAAAGGGGGAPNPTAASAPVRPSAGGGAKNGGGGGAGSASWRDKSSAFRDAMKAARQYSQAVAEGKPLPPPVASAPDPSLVPCPHCNRSFNAKAAERHIPQCQNIRAKPSALKRGTGGAGGVNGSVVAKQAAVQRGRGKGSMG